MNEICSLSLKQLRDAVKRRSLSFKEIAEAYLERIDEAEPELKAFVTTADESSVARAGDLDNRLAKGDLRLGYLTGLPIGIKDNIVTKNIRTTCGSRILDNWVPPYDATAVRKLKANQALLFGKTNCDEFAMGSSTENSAHYPTRNPWDLDRVPGGSSGGSAAAVAAHLVPAALGSDTGGSIRQPAAFCGVVGLKPTYGRISRYGLVAFGSSLDQIGPLTNTVRDAALLLQVLAGRDRADSTSAHINPDNYLSYIGKDVHGLRVGVPKEWMGSGLVPEVKSAVQDALKVLEGLGCCIEEVLLPHTSYAVATYYIIAPAEASANLARYDGVKYGHRSSRKDSLAQMYENSRTEGFGDEVKRRIMIGTYVLSSGYYDAYYLKASKVRTLIQQDYLKAFENVDLLVGPTTPTLPFKLGEKTSDPLEMYLSDVFTVTANLAGVPALSMPCSFTEKNLPVGLQLIGPHFKEGRLLRVAHALESELKLPQPPLAV
jgi:aspartyl-tRNA(Asn)/glutamyl-tRNA(Gln) amidotransferase subunit A